MEEKKLEKMKEKERMLWDLNSEQQNINSQSGDENLNCGRRMSELQDKNPKLWNKNLQFLKKILRKKSVFKKKFILWLKYVFIDLYTTDLKPVFLCQKELKTLKDMTE